MAARHERRGLAASRIIGREREIQLLADQAIGTPSITVVEGEAGVGKTRLIQELRRDPRLRVAALLIGHTHRISESLPLSPIVDAVRTVAPQRWSTLGLSPLAGALRSLLPENEGLPPALEASEDRGADRHRAFSALVELLGALGPCVLVVEDVQWADDSTTDFLLFLVTLMPPTLALVLTFRRHEPAASAALAAELLSRRVGEVSALRIALEPLEEPEVALLVEDILETSSVSAAFTRYLHDRSGGLPFAIEEVLQLLRDRGELVELDGAWARKPITDLSVPATISESVLSRLAGLSADAQASVRALSVLARGAHASAIAAIAQIPLRRTAEGLDDAVRWGMVEGSDDGYVFRHPLVRDAIYSDLGMEARRRLHRRAGRALLRTGAPAPLVEIAHHLRRAGALREWARHAHLAASRAMEAGDDAKAVDLLHEVVREQCLSPNVRARAGVALASAALHALRHEEIGPAIAELLREPDIAPSIAAELHLGVGLLWDQGGDATAAAREFEAAVAVSDGDPRVALQALSALAWPWKTVGRLDEHAAVADRAEAIEKAETDPVLRRSLEVNLATCRMGWGDPRGRRALPTILDPGDGSAAMTRQRIRACFNAGQAIVHLGHIAETDRLLELGLRLSTEIGYGRHLGGLRATALLADFYAGRWQGLGARAEELRAELDGIRGDSLDAAFVAAAMSVAMDLARGRAAELVWICDEATETGSYPILTNALVILARRALARGRAEDARALAVRGIDAIRTKGIWVWAAPLLPTAVEVLVALDDPRAAEELLSEYVQGVEGREAPAADAASATGAALLAPPDRLRSRFEIAVRGWSALGNPYEEASVVERWGRAVVHEDRKNSGALLLDACERYGALGAEWDRRRVRMALRELGFDAGVAWRGGRRGYGDTLSPRETEVVGLAAEGRTNREIGERLFISSWTVANHLSNAMRKLRVRSRRELAGVLAAKNGSG